MPEKRDSMQYDIVIVGAGPAGLSAAIHLKQLSQQQGGDISVCVLEKGSEPGAHIISGAIMDSRALNELLPDWKSRGAPVSGIVTQDQFFFLTKERAFRTPGWMLPATLKNRGNDLVSLSRLVRWLAEQAEELGVEIFSGFPATEILYNEAGKVCGVATGASGIDRHGKKTETYQAGVEILSSYTLFAEGARGQLGRQLTEKYKLDKNKDPQAYALSLKEIWEIDPKEHHPGQAIHTAGWPLDNKTYGGSFLYHMDKNQIAIGLTVGLSYKNPYLSPYNEFQRYKEHPLIQRFLKKGKRIAYGARVMAAGGLQAMPDFVFPGGALLGGNGGFMNAARLKGIHTAIKSGMLAAEAAYSALQENRKNDVLFRYQDSFQQSWLYKELHQTRNFKPWMSKGLLIGTLMTGLEQLVLRGNAIWTLHRNRPDYTCLKKANECEPIAYKKPDNKLTFEVMSSLYLSGTHHEENQPSHLLLKNDAVPVKINLAKYAGPEARYCPAAVYKFVKDKEGISHLRIHASNCLHCKACDIKDPTQNITWVAPEGGDGPEYQDM